jgi:hypothetical protein
MRSPVTMASVRPHESENSLALPALEDGTGNMMNGFVLGLAAVHAVPAFFGLMCFALLSAALSAAMGRHRAISVIAFLMVFGAMLLVSLPLGGVGLLLALIAQGMNMLPGNEARSDGRTSDASAAN